MNHVPTWIVGLALTAAAEIFAIGLMLLTRAISGVERLKLNNEVAGFKFAVVGLFYGVLLAFVVIAVWDEYRNTETAVRDEAKAVVDLHRVTVALPFEAGNKIRQLLITYTDHVRKYEWPTMARGRPSEDASKDLDQLSTAIFELEPQGYRQLMLYQAALRLLAVIADNRNERLDGADGSMSGLLWFVLIVGAGVTLGYPAFFGASNLLAQTLMTAALKPHRWPATVAVRLKGEALDRGQIPRAIAQRSISGGGCAAGTARCVPRLLSRRVASAASRS